MPFCWLSKYLYDPDDQRFHQASRWKLCGIKWRFDKIISVCDKLSTSNYIFQAWYLLLRIFVMISWEFCWSIAQWNPDQVQSLVCGKLTHKYFINYFLHNTILFNIIIEWKVLYVEKNIFNDFFDRSRISDRRHVNTTENAMSPPDIFISIWFGVC